jgi:hypothetical protein
MKLNPKKMKIKELKKRPEIDHNKNQMRAHAQLDKLLTELKKRELPVETVMSINNEIDQFNSVSTPDKGLIKQIKKTQSDILKLIETNHQLVTKNHYQNTWMTVGMAAFGLPLGVVFGTSLGNMALLAIGLPIGMVVGMVVGSEKDKKAFKEGRQIDLEIKD